MRSLSSLANQHISRLCRRGPPFETTQLAARATARRFATTPLPTPPAAAAPSKSPPKIASSSPTVIPVEWNSEAVAAAVAWRRQRLAQREAGVVRALELLGSGGGDAAAFNAALDANGEATFTLPFPATASQALCGAQVTAQHGTFTAPPCPSLSDALAITVGN